MPDVFVCAAPGDGAFAQRLSERLTADGRAVVRDAEPGSPLRDMIEAADAFLFVVSPEACTSEACAEPLRHAAALNKRIVPVVAAEPAGATVPPAVAARNWIFFRPSDEFDRAFDTLRAALDTDLEWLRAHTRLAVLAREWDARGRNDAALLRGSELAAAESAIASHASAEPAPTALQSAFVVAGRRAESRRLRRTVSLAGIALGVSAVLAIVAVLNANRASAQSKRARSRSLAAQSEAAIATDPQRSIELARQAVAAGVTPDATRMLRRSLLNARQLRVLTGHKRPVFGVAWRPDGARFVSVDGGGVALVWDARTGKVVLRIATNDIPPVLQVRYSHDGRLIAIASGTVASIWDADTGRRVTTLRTRSLDKGKSRGFHDIVFSRDDSEVLAAAHDGDVLRFGVRSGRLLGYYVQTRTYGHYEAGVVRSVAYGQGHDLIGLVAPEGGGGEVYIWDDRNLFWILHTSLRWTPGEIAVRPSGSDLAVADKGGIISVSSIDGRLGRYTIGAHRGPATSVSYSADSTRIVSSGVDGTIAVWDAATGLPELTAVGHAGGVGDAQFSPDGRRILSGGYDGTVRIWDAVLTSPVRKLADSGDVWLGVDWSRDGKRVALAGRDGRAVVYDAASGALVTALPHQAIVTGVDYSSDGELLATSSVDGKVRLWKTKGYGLAVTLDHGKPATDVCIGSRLIAVPGFDGTLSLWDRRNGKRVRTFHATKEDRLNACALSSDGELVAASSSRTGKIYVWRTTTERDGFTLASRSPFVASVEFDPSGRRLLATEGSNAVLWDLERRAVAARLFQGNALGAAHFSPDGSLILTCGSGNPGTLWDASGSRIASFDGPKAFFTGCAFEPGGRGFAVTGYRPPNEGGFALRYVCAECGEIPELVRLAEKRIAAGGNR